jgi:signal transduction histidine kinase/ligand-binding sensor domain-containing protein
MRLEIRLFIIFLCSFDTTFITAQHYNVKFKHIGIQEGLSNNHITDILQDEFGYMWIATERGLNRYDGHQMIIFPNQNESVNLFLNHEIIGLERNMHGGIWILTKKGLTLYNKGKFQVKPLATDPGIIINSAAVIDNKNWFFTTHGIYGYNEELELFDKISIVGNTDFKYSFLNNTGISTAFLEPNLDQLWICTSSKGVYVKKLSSNLLQPYLFKPNESQAANNIFVKKILKDNLGNIWFAGPEGLWLKPHHSDTPKRIEFSGTSYNNNEIFYIEKDHENNIWCAVSDLGIIVLNDHGEVIEHIDGDDHNMSDLSSGFINKIIFDHQNNLWLGHKEEGIDFLATKFDRKIGYYRNLTDIGGFMSTKVKRIVPLKNDDILIAYESPNNPIVSGLNLISTGQGNFLSQPEQIKGITLNQDDLDITEVITVDNQIGVSTYDHIYTFEMSLLDQETPTIDIKPRISQFDEFVMFHYIHQNKYWLLGQNLRTYNISTHKEEIHSENLNLDRFLIDDQDIMWGAASHSGLVIIDLKQKKKLQQFFNEPLNNKSISDNNINCLYKDTNGTMWVGTEFGLNKIENAQSAYAAYEPEKFKSSLKDLEFQRFKIEDGLSGNSIKSILEDNRKRLWLSTDHGVSMLDLNTKEIYKLGKQEGIQEGNFIVNSSAKGEDGTIYFGGEMGLNFFNPDSINFVKPKSQIFINNLKILNQTVMTGVKYRNRIILENNIETTEQIELNYKEKLIHIGFVAIDFEHPQEIKYYHKMEGFDIDWVKSKPGTGAYYTRVPAGEYTFRVKAQTSHNQWIDEARLKVIIHPPFWMSWWFVSLVVLLTSGLVILYIRLRLSSIKRQKNKLEEIVHERTQELEKANMGLLEQKDEIQLQRDQLQKLNQRIKRSNAIKLSFFTNISHELRTPLTLIIAPIEQLIRSKGLTPEIQQKHSLIYKSTLRLNELINQLLQFRKMETGNLKLEARKSDLIPFLKNLSDQFVEYANQSEIQYKFNCDIKSVVTWYDGDKLTKIISNLLSNAFKYTPKGGIVRLNISCTPAELSKQYIKIEVADTGIGIANSELTEIFDPFYQHENPNLKAEGTGIGLHYTRSLVKLHKGDIKVESELGKGSKFTVTIPLDGAYLGKNEKIKLADDTFNPAGEKFYSIHNNIQIKMSKTTQFDKDKHTLLIVEDNLDMCLLIQNLLEDDYNIEITNNGKDALSYLKTSDTIDLVISDVMMPVMDGISFCKSVKTDINTSHLPVIMLTP